MHSLPCLGQVKSSCLTIHKLVKEDFVQYNKVEICGINTSELKVLKESEKIELLKKSSQRRQGRA